VASGFHSEVEASCLGVLLRGSHPVVWCLARRLDAAVLGRCCLEAAAAGKLLVLSGFGPSALGGSRARAAERNLLVAALSAQLLVIYASPGGSVERCAGRLPGRVLTLAAPENERLLARGARPVVEARPSAP
jgi:hypothetical protein